MMDGAHSVMVIIIINGHSDLISNLHMRLFAFHIALVPLGKV